MPGEYKKSMRFPHTRWSMVGRASMSDQATREEAMTELLVAYLPGLRAFLVETRRIPEDLAADLLHTFITDKILVAKLVTRADPKRGRFRNFVLKSLNNFIADKLRREYAIRAASAGLDDEFIDSIAAKPEADQFDQQWVKQVVEDTIRIMEVDCRERERDDLWRIFDLRIVGPFLRHEDPLPYDELVRAMDLGTPRQAINLLATAKRSFMRHLNTAIAKYVDSEDQIEGELAELRLIIGR